MRRHFDLVSKYNVGLKTLLLEDFSEPEFYGDSVYKFRKLIGKNDFPYHFKKIIVRYKMIGYKIDVLRQTAFYSILFYPITLDGRRGTTGHSSFATVPFHLDLFSAALVELAKSISVHSLILSSHLFSFPFTVPCRIVFAKPEDLETWPNHLNFRFLTRVRSSSYSPMAAWIFLRTSSLVTWSLYEMFNSLR